MCQKYLVYMLEENKTLLTLNIESNLLTGLVVADIVRATLTNKTLIDLRLSNQVSGLGRCGTFSLRMYILIKSNLSRELKYLAIRSRWTLPTR